ncbi:MAG: glutamine synthetase family protein [Silicimonas sp.]|nr:glutamine synthetase family protein [Silicimonas sp.]
MADWMSKAPKATKEFVDGRRVDEIECLISDLSGIARGKAMPASKFARQTHFYLPNSIYYQTITGGWSDEAATDGFTEPDMVMKPDYSTARAAPWTADCTLQVIHDAYTKEGDLVPYAPRNVLQRVVDLYRARGWKPVVAPEMEFYLVARNVDPAQEIKAMTGRSGRPAAARQAYSVSAVDEFGPVIDDIYDFAEAQGFEIDGITQEGGAGQLEINMRHGDAIKLADEIFYFKRLIREAALRHNCFATFMAKPIEGEPGSAMHIHHSVLSTETGKNVFTGVGDEETPEFMHFIGGLQHYMSAATIVFAPYVNSFRRYVKDHAAPINIEWGRDNRTTAIRVPVADPQARRVENRIAGMDCNPYLGIAASLACGYLGMVEKIAPKEEFKGDAYDAEEELPRGIYAALDEFSAAKSLREVLGEGFCHVYGAVKEAEYDDFLQVISPWEREHLLLNV